VSKGGVKLFIASPTPSYRCPLAHRGSSMLCGAGMREANDPQHYSRYELSALWKTRRRTKLRGGDIVIPDEAWSCVDQGADFSAQRRGIGNPPHHHGR
jgi:hypothetical protein